ncbi:MAG: hypothetical protein HOK67_27405 [Deltaproteobacteria bacterium]|jgi:hypothetical protein|nr:hypothetical protein [Deltaproteobacteria bacterium]MBT4644122.1 hypothetical protein [Deltaproteobacteria bacterium]MBT6503626.1 hypothetical protein [Deltaproteobacteria bacterium]
MNDLVKSIKDQYPIEATSDENGKKINVTVRNDYIKEFISLTNEIGISKQYGFNLGLLLCNKYLKEKKQGGKKSDPVTSVAGLETSKKTKPQPLPKRIKNNSGQGKVDELPEGVKGWCWGAFLLNTDFRARFNRQII